MSELRNPRTTHFEFSGPLLGPAGIVVGLPILTFASSYLFRGSSWTVLDSLDVPLTWESLRAAFSLQAFLVYYAWFALLLILLAVVPGPTFNGTKLRDGRRLPYKLNGWTCFVIVHLLLIPVHLYVAPLTWIYDNWMQLVTAMITTSIVGSIALYLSSFDGGDSVLLAAGGNSGAVVRLKPFTK